MFFLYTKCSTSEWVSVHKKIFNSSEQDENKYKTSLLFTKQEIPLFSQLIFGWNAFRPPQGFYSFFVKSRDAGTKKWGKWHRMIDWGKDVQRSYMTSTDGSTKYIHVRLETELLKYADSFKIKIRGYEGACLSYLKGFVVTTTHFGNFKRETLGAELQNLKSVFIKGVPRISQFALEHAQNYRLCSPTSCSIFSHFITGQPTNPLEFAQHVFDQGLQIYGSWPFNTAHLFEQCNGELFFYPTRLNSFVQIYKQLKQGLPVVASVRGELPGGAKPYNDGHLLVIVGWDAQNQQVICHDPAFAAHKETRVRYPVYSFLRAWERSKRLVYWAERYKKN